MDIRRLGKSGLAVSVVGLGCNNFGGRIDLDRTREVIHASLDAGITLFDTADSYGESESMIGEVLEGRRDDVIIATKFGSDLARAGGRNGTDWGARGSRRYIQRAVESSLRRLRTDWIDLYQLHQPDPATPIDETLSALSDLVHQGKIRYFGHSNFSGAMTADAEWTARTRGHERFISAQNEYSWLKRDIERDLVPALEQYRVGLLPFFPLASGLLTGKYHRGSDAPSGTRLAGGYFAQRLAAANFDVIEGLESFATERGVGLLDVAIGGLAAKPSVTSVIAGATSAEQVAANAKAGEWRPSADDLIELDRITAGK
jgi:aryl-alcohol dehydrogenase-like predicted oxidoreductase